MKLLKTLLLLSIFLVSCSSSDDNSNDDIEINTEVEITISGDDIGTFNFNDLDFGSHQQCVVFELYSNNAFQNESISVGYFLLQFQDVSYFQLNNPNETYSYDGPAIRDFFDPINALVEVNSELYEATTISFELTSRLYKDEATCGDFYDQAFDINFTITLEHSNGNLAPIMIAGSTVDLPIIDNCGC